MNITFFFDWVVDLAIAYIGNKYEKQYNSAHLLPIIWHTNEKQMWLRT